MGDDDVARLEARHIRADLEHFRNGAVAGIDLAAPRLGDVRGIGEGRVVDVVLRRNGQDPQVDVPRTALAQLELVELDHVGDVELVQVAADALALRGDGLCADRIGLGHRPSPLVGPSYAGSPAPSSARESIGYPPVSLPEGGLS
jgi:hypothetical protein